MMTYPERAAKMTLVLKQFRQLPTRLSPIRLSKERSAPTSAYVQVARTPRRSVGAARGVCRRPRSAKARNRRGGARRVQAVLWGIGAQRRKDIWGMRVKGDNLSSSISHSRTARRTTAGGTGTRLLSPPRRHQNSSIVFEPSRKSFWTCFSNSSDSRVYIPCLSAF